jgi:hypothetical protein
VTSDAFSQKYRYIFFQGQVSGNLTVVNGETTANLNLGDMDSFAPEFVFFKKVTIRRVTDNWQITSVTNLEGSKYSQVAAGGVAGLTSVSVDSFTVNGNGTPSNPLYASNLAPALDAVDAVSITKADKITKIFSVDTTNNRVGINTTIPTKTFEVNGEISSNGLFYLTNTAYTRTEQVLVSSTGGTVNGVGINTGLIVSSTAITNITNSSNWNGKDYIGSAITSDGQYYEDNSFFYFNIDGNLRRLRLDYENIYMLAGTGNTSYTATEENDTIFINGSGGTKTLIVTPKTNGKDYIVKVLDITNPVYLSGSTCLIDGTTGITFSSSNEGYKIKSYNNNYYIV